MRIRVTAFLVAAFVYVSAPALLTGQSEEPLASELQRVVTAARLALGAEGISVAVIGPDGEVMTAAAGERQAGVPVSPQVAFEIGSVSKIATAALALRAEREGLLSLEDSVADFLPDLPRAKEISLRQLLNHTSGLHDPLQESTFLMQYFLNPTRAPNRNGLLAAVRSVDFEPGESWRYSNTGFIATAQVLEQVYGSSFSEIVERKLLQPLGISGVAAESWQNEAIPLAHGFRDLSGSGTYVDMNAFSDSGPFLRASSGAGSLLATAEGLAQLVHQILAGDALTEAERAAMQGWIERPDGHRYGLGLLRVEDARGRVLLGHRGNSAGFSAEAWHLPDQRVTLAVLTNRGGISVASVTQALLDYWFSDDKG